MIELARVVAVHPEANSVDIQVMRDGRRVAGVQCVGQFCGTDFGVSGMVPPTVEGYDKAPSGARDILAVVAFMGGHPVVLGFLYPQVCQMLFGEVGRFISRYPSDVYSTVSPTGDFEFYHPSGAFVRFGESTAHEDLSGKDYDGKWAASKNSARKVSIHVEQAGGTAAVTIDPNGNITISCEGDLSVSVGGKTDIGSGGAMSVTAPSVTISGPTKIDGDLTVTGDAVAGGISLQGHTHTEQGDGAEVSTPH